MRLPTDVRTRFPALLCALGLSVMLAACGRGGGDLAPIASAADRPAAEFAYGPEADYPLVIGDAYTIGDQTYTPLDTMNYDEVGFVAVDGGGGNEVSIAHKTLPLPSYVEITSLDTGKTVLARAARRGPMSNNHVAALSPGALTQLGIQNGASVRIRRTNPPESDRAKLRMGQPAMARMDTPKSLLKVLKRKMPERGSVSLASAASNPVSRPQARPVNNLPTVAASSAAPPKTNATKELPAVATSPRSKPLEKAPTRVAVAPSPKPGAFSDAFSGKRRTVTAYPLPPMSGAKTVTATRVASVSPPPVRVTRNAIPANAASSTAKRQPPKPVVAGAFVVQAAAFSSKANAERAADSIDGFVQKSGKFFRVRTGPFANRGQAEAALAKVRAAGYDDARVFTAG